MYQIPAWNALPLWLKIILIPLVVSGAVTVAYIAIMIAIAILALLRDIVTGISKISDKVRKKAGLPVEAN